MTEKLKSCPFCNETQVTLTRWSKGVAVWEVFCLNCKASTGAKFHENEAVEHWNTRADMHTELVEALEAAMEGVHNFHRDYVHYEGGKVDKELNRIWNELNGAALKATKEG